MSIANSSRLHGRGETQLRLLHCIREGMEKVFKQKMEIFEKWVTARACCQPCLFICYWVRTAHCKKFQEKVACWSLGLGCVYEAFPPLNLLCTDLQPTFTASLNFIDIWEFHTCLAGQLHTFKRARSLIWTVRNTLPDHRDQSQHDNSMKDLFSDKNRE